MNDETLENTEAELEPVEAEEPGTAPEEIESSEGEESTAAEPPRAVFTPEQQAIFNEAIGRKVAKTKEAERRAEAAEQRLRELEQKLPADPEPSVPPLPDRWDDDYAEKLEARDKAIAEHAAWRGRQEVVAQYRAQQEMQQHTERQQALARKVESYGANAKRLGFKPEQLEAAAQVVQMYGISDDLADFILQHESGPAVTLFLSQNPDELERMQGLGPAAAGAYMATQVLPRALSRTGKANNVEPPETLSGGGVPRKEGGPKGATYE